VPAESQATQAQAGRNHRDNTPTGAEARIAVIKTGMVGRGLAAALVKAGHKVVIGPATLR
jgi:hypothetical protein